MDELWSDQLVVNNPANMVVRRAQVLELMSSGVIAYDSFERTPEAVQIIGDTALVMGREVVTPAPTAPLAGKTVTRRFTNVWRRTDGRWQLVGRQATVVAIA